MLRVSVSRKGSLGRFMQDAIAQTEGRNLDRALAAGALLPVNAAKRYAPYRTGNLRRSLHVGGFEEMTPDRSGIVQRGAAVPGPNGAVRRRSVYWGTDVVYARTQEYGRGNIPARGYIRRAHAETRAAVVREVGEALVQLLRAAAR